MATKEKFEALRAAVDTATDRIADAVAGVAADVDGLKAQIKALMADKGMSEAEEEAILASFTAPLAKLAGVETALRSIGKDPENPVPAPVAASETTPFVDRDGEAKPGEGAEG